LGKLRSWFPKKGSCGPSNPRKRVAGRIIKGLLSHFSNFDEDTKRLVFSKELSELCTIQQSKNTPKKFFSS
jgi:hypothetical protein